MDEDKVAFTREKTPEELKQDRVLGWGCLGVFVVVAIVNYLFLTSDMDDGFFKTILIIGGVIVAIGLVSRGLSILLSQSNKSHVLKLDSQGITYNNSSGAWVNIDTVKLVKLPSERENLIFSKKNENERGPVEIPLVTILNVHLFEQTDEIITLIEAKAKKSVTREALEQELDAKGFFKAVGEGMKKRPTTDELSEEEPSAN